MPTPSRDDIVDASRASHISCPPEEDRSNTWGIRDLDEEEPDHGDAATMLDRQIPSPPAESHGPSNPAQPATIQSPVKQITIEEDSPVGDMMSPVSIEDKRGDSERRITLTDGYTYGAPSMSYEFSNVRLIPSSPSSFLRVGSKFRGTQQSERQKYDVQVDIKHVDMRESFLCGYLRIQGLTEDHPTLTTYFEGEIIGSKYSFLTQHEDWGSTDKVDLQHWAKFNAFRPFAKQARKGNLYIPHLAQRENIFMRWKEHFLVPDHRVRTISGASFEGFYYICFNQIAGTVSGIYFHAKSEKFQQLELKHVEDRGCFSSLEFR